MVPGVPIVPGFPGVPVVPMVPVYFFIRLRKCLINDSYKISVYP